MHRRFGQFARRSWRWIIASVALSSALIMGPGRFALAEPATADLTKTVDEIRQRHKAPAAAVAVVRDGMIVAEGLSGVRRLGGTEHVSREDRFKIGSCGKSATRLLIGRLVDRGLLRFDSTLAELLPDVSMRDEYRAVTVGDLMSHRGGVRPYTRIAPRQTPVLFEGKGTGRDQRATFIDFLLKESPIAKPGTRYEYSNAGYALLGHIAERLSDRPFEQLIQDEVFAPLGMGSALVGTPLQQSDVPGWHGHTREEAGLVPSEGGGPRLPALAPAGLISCSIGDFAKLAAMLCRIEAGKESTFVTAATAQRLKELRPGDGPSQGTPFFGGDGHYTAAFALWPSQGLAIVSGTNAGDSDDLCADLIDAARKAVAPEVAGAAPPAAAMPGKPRFGFMLAINDDGSWIVDSVNPGSPAERAGLQADDAIVAINGRPLAEMEPDERTAAIRSSPVKLSVKRGEAVVELELKAP